jgi:hypothetical protein
MSLKHTFDAPHIVNIGTAFTEGGSGMCTVVIPSSTSPVSPRPPVFSAEWRAERELSLPPEERGLVFSLEKNLKKAEDIIKEDVERNQLELFWKMAQEVFLPAFAKEVNKILEGEVQEETYSKEPKVALRFTVVVPSVHGMGKMVEFFSSTGFRIIYSKGLKRNEKALSTFSVKPGEIDLEEDPYYRECTFDTVTFEYQGCTPRLFDASSLEPHIKLHGWSVHTFAPEDTCYRVYLLALKAYVHLTKVVVTDCLANLVVKRPFRSPCIGPADDLILFDFYKRAVPTLPLIQYEEKTRKFYFN